MSTGIKEDEELCEPMRKFIAQRGEIPQGEGVHTR